MYTIGLPHLHVVTGNQTSQTGSSWATELRKANKTYFVSSRCYKSRNLGFSTGNLYIFKRYQQITKMLIFQLYNYLVFLVNQYL